MGKLNVMDTEEATFISENTTNKEAQLLVLTTRAAELISQARRIVVFTGAGMSVESGIPDFR